MMTRIFCLFLSILLFLSFASCERSFKYDLEDVPEFEGLAAPAPDEGYQIHVAPFPVPENFEREIFVRKEVGNWGYIYANRFHVKCRPGTHHMIAYGYSNESADWNPEVDVMRDPHLPDGRLNFNLTMGSGAMYCGVQEEEYVLQLPPGVAVYIKPNATMDINSHYFNRTDDVLFGEVFMNIYTIPEEEVTEILQINDIDNRSKLFLPKGEATTID